MSNQVQTNYPWQSVGSFYELGQQYGKLTVAQAANLRLVQEVNAATSNLAFPVMVAARAALQLATLVDARQFCRTEMIPEGGGLTYHFQYVTMPSNWSTSNISAYTGAGSSDITANDPTFTDVSATVATYPARTFVEDKVQRQLAYNLAQVLGIAHGSVLNAKINALLYSTINGATTNVENVGTSGGASVNYTFTNIFDMRGMVEKARFRPDTFVTYPQLAADGSGGVTTGFYPFMMSNITSVQFTSAFIDYLRTGNLTEMFGLKLYLDSVYAPSDGKGDSTGDALCAILQSGEAVGWAQTEDVTSEIQRWAPQVGFNLVTHIIGAGAKIVDPAIATVQHL